MGHDALVRSNGDDMRCKCAMMYTYDVYMTKLVTITATTSSTRYVELFLTPKAVKVRHLFLTSALL